MTHQNITVTDLLPDYKLTIPRHLQAVLAVGVGGGIVGLALIVLMLENLRLLAFALLIIGVLAVGLTVLLLMVTNDAARLSARRKIMNAVAWRGDEMVLDVGCGNGFLMLEAAKHLTTGKAIGIDVWVEDSGGQNAPAVWRNADIEGVADKIDLQNVDARSMPFENDSFDVIVSSLALHHMGDNTDREQALAEMARVLKPGGIVLLYDMFPMIGQAANVMRQRNFKRIDGLGGVVLKVLSARK